MIRKSNAFYGMNCRLSVFFKATLWLGLFTPLTLFAQQDASKAKKADSIDKVNQLKEVQIRTLKISRRQTSSTPLQILSGEELQKLNSLSVADAVRYFSGVQLKDYGGLGGLKTINVRSMGTNHTAVFYDGVQLGNAQNGQVDLGKFSLDNIEEIELYNGQKSTIFQPAKGFASGSSLYLKSKQPDFSDGRTQKIRAAIKGGSFGLLNPSLLWQSKISNRVYSSLSAEYKNAHGRYKFRSTNGVYDTTQVRTDGDIETMRLELGLNGILPDSSKWRVKLYGYRDNQGLPGAVVANVSNFPQRLWNRNAFLQSSYEKNIGKYSLLATAKYANDYQRYLNPERININGFEENKYHQQEIYLSFVNKLEMTKYWDIVLSADYQWNKLDADLYRFAYPVRNTVLTALATQFKLDRFDIQANLLSTLKYDQTREGPGDPDRNELTPTVMVSWQPFNQKEFRVRSFYKSIFRMPTFNDLYYTYYGFVVLKPEYTKQYDLGFTYLKAYENKLLSQFSVQADLYYNKVRDKIMAVPANNPVRWRMENIGLVEIKGIDVNIQSAWQLGPDLKLNAGISYTYQQAIDADKKSDSYKDQIPYTPWHNGSFLASASYKKLSFNYSYLYTGERYDQTANNINNYVLPWYTHDAALHYHTKFNKKAMRLTAEINNLLNQAYEVVTNFPMPGRHYRFSLTYNY
ncbi:vitamin B12 transporter [Pedobacter africanus]|uniref:Outer membrane cobalamin receptor n=1 Tax=Pedobacter africanus TaxID=151894 RepID=A0ACC6KTP4_9SPHI|nr:TonB-dependent receptor [Pedobacter africanus]MDR6782519.1 outer membrane cobalamin receptor [Pedobacter africanus]